ncbi:MAG: multifunctional CCA tRNA nucleotidyl transferase/2'3'-cyclic phosphodiesterase/2'nucleotidase/phosphatase [Rubrivivax sp.]|nr:multifunctional CCA tRNA nucleotidyl transferase/2'3'-cyclic phosphodiesterase/2'nucleotidase/phosphatase [Rubrivivax sp.]
MQLYIVGGAVRDRLLGEPVSDRDWVAVGTTPEELLALGYKPVGKDFPVFLHPTTGEEVALARTERKSGRGYHGFTFHAAPEVTLEQDLARRDLTINAMAEAADGTLIDPFGGRHDLAGGVLRHVSPAFAEDPVRLLRLARFAARWPHFTVAPETEALLAQLVQAGEVDALVPERVWQELARGLMARRPSRMFEVLRGCGALARLLPEPRLDAAALAQVDAAAAAGAALAVRFALLGWAEEGEAGASPAVARAAQRLRVPTEVRELAQLFAREGERLAAWRPAGPRHDAQADAVLALLERCDAFRQPQRFRALLEAARWSQPLGGGPARGTPGGGPARGTPGAAAEAIDTLGRLHAAAAGADTATAAQRALDSGARGPKVGQAVQQARLAALRAAWPAARQA